MKRLVVIGGGISGLAAAHAAAERSAALGGSGELEIVVLEREACVGGKARTSVADGFTVECGPNGFLAPDAGIDRLVRAAGLEGELLPADEAAARRFVVRGGRMRQVSAHPLRFAWSGILSPLGILRLLGEPLIPGRARDAGDESVWDFARRRLGRQAADRLVAPMVLGVFAGDARRLSLPAAFPRLAALEADHGSLVRGMLARRRQLRDCGAGGPASARRRGQDAGGLAAEGGAAGGPAGPAGHLTSFAAGIETLPVALARGPAHHAAIEVRVGAPVTAVERAADGRFEVRFGRRAELGGETLVLDADAVVLACEAWAGAALVRELAPTLARGLSEIYYPPVAVAALGFTTEGARGIPRGFGVLVPRGEGYRVLGVLWDSYIFPGRSPDGTVLARAMFGGAVDPEAVAADDATLLRWARDDLRRLLGVYAAPLFTRVHRWERAIPQYELGHAERVRAIEREAAREPGLFLAGNALHGIAFGKAAGAGLAAGEAAASFLAR
ncbi:MAG TPA: protoporphyrinogen oxidase [Thermoanaerobaculia bacterium]|nr:protoporphyrinogen oxidase [Thermoanaerobaculia bacterium]